jgi:hypothetical protein
MPGMPAPIANIAANKNLRILPLELKDKPVEMPKPLNFLPQIGQIQTAGHGRRS